MGFFLKNAKLYLGTGQDDFSMDRGSFDYKRSEDLKLLTPGEKNEAEDSCEEHFSGEGGLEAVLSMNQYDDREVYSIRAAPGADRFRLTFDTDENMHIYGAGETYSEFDLSGVLVRNWVAEHQNSRRIEKKLRRQAVSGIDYDHRLDFGEYETYYAEPAFTIVRDDGTGLKEPVFMYIDTDRYAEFDFRTNGKMTFDLEEACSITVIHADTFTELSEKTADLLGHQLPLPEWLYDGVILGIQQGPEVIDEKIRKAKEHGTKITGIWSQDWCGCRRTGFGYQVMWNWEYDRTLYHDLPEYIRKWNAEGIRFLGYINPFLAIEKDVYKEASEKGYCVKDKNGDDYLVTITTFPAAMIDFTNPDAYEFYKNIIKKNLIGIGISGWMADFGEYLPTDAVLYSGEPAEKLHNSWPAIWAKCNKEAIEESGKTKECFFFTRAGYTGTVGTSTMMWTGDQHVDWSVDDGIHSVIPATLSLAMSGIGMAHSDVGGYTTMQKEMCRSKELLMRWEEMNVYSPLWRTHEGNQPINDVQFDADDELLDFLGRCSRLHVALKDYLMELEKECREKGTPVMRPLFYHYPESRFSNETTEYLLGREMLIAPILKPGVDRRTVVLPDDNWIEVWTGEKVSGGEAEYDGIYGKMPVFVRDSEKGRAIREKLLGVAE
ncbi:MAG: alpha-glucosidase [Candidatus Weimeria sp.]